MMTDQNLTLSAAKRDLVGKQVKQLRADGKLPAVVYGFETENTPLVIDAKLFRKIYREAGTNTLVTLELDGKAIKVLIHDIQLDPVYDQVEHVDFYAVNMKEKVETEVPLTFIGVAPAVKELQGNFVENRHEIEISALPTEIPQEIEVDISVLATFDDMIRAKDLKLPTGVELVEDPETTIAFVEEPMSEAELEAELADTSAEAEEQIEALGAEKAEGEAAEGEESETDEKSDDKNATE